jgi:hypothetical protein
MPEGAAKQLLEFLAKAPPGSYETSEESVGTKDEELQRLHRRLDTLFEDLNHVQELLAKQKDSETLSEIKDVVGEFRDLHYENVASVEKTIRQTLSDYFESVPPAREMFVKKHVAAFVTGRIQPVLPGEPVALSYTKCTGCNSQIVTTDSFCYHCGRPNVLGEASSANKFVMDSGLR